MNHGGGAYIIPSGYMQNSPSGKARQSSPGGKVRQSSPIAAITRPATPTAKVRQVSPGAKIRPNSPGGRSWQASPAGKIHQFSPTGKRSISTGRPSRPSIGDATRRRSSICAAGSSSYMVDLHSGSMKALRLSKEELLDNEGKENLSSQQNKDTRNTKDVFNTHQKVQIKAKSSPGNKIASSKLANVSVARPVIHDRRWTDGSLSWENLPERLAFLGKEVMHRKTAASLAAAHALQEASAAESVIRCLSMFAELRSKAKPESPDLTMECFFTLYQSLQEALKASQSLSEVKSLGSSLDVVKDLVKEKHGNAQHWIDVALASDLAPVSLFCKQFAAALKSSLPKGTLSPQGLLPLSKHAKASYERMPSLQKSSFSKADDSPVILKTSSSSVDKADAKGTQSKSGMKCRSQEARHLLSPGNTLNQTIGASSAKETAKNAGALPADAPTSVGVDAIGCAGDGLQETVELATKLQWELQMWFLKFVEEALECDFQSSCSSTDGSSEGKLTQKENNHIAFMLSQIKRVNDWVDEIESNDKKPLEPKVEEILDKVKAKVYDFLLLHVESAATALGRCI